MARVITEQDDANVGPLELKEPGTPAWGWQTVSLLQGMWKSSNRDADRYDEVYQEVVEQRIWETIPVEAPYGSEEAMQKKLRIGDGADMRARVSKLAIQTRTNPLAKHGGTNAHNKEEGAPGHLPRGTNSSEYLSARLERDFPEIHKRMEQGEFKSVAAAARLAGIYPDRPKTIQVPEDKNKVTRSLLRVYGPDGCRELAALLAEAADTDAQN